MRIPRFRRYTAGAWIYDLISGERPVYRPGRLAGIELAGLAAGARVLDLGCGTGLNLAPLLLVVGPGGQIVGVDASPAMLRAARRRRRDRGWSNVDLRRGDAGRLSEVLDGAEPFDAVIVTYALSIIRDWRDAFEQSLAALRPGGRMVVVDMSYPTGRWLVFAPLAALAFVVGGVHPHRAPWRLVDEQTVDVRHTTLRGGHVHVAVGTRP